MKIINNRHWQKFINEYVQALTPPVLSGAPLWGIDYEKQLAAKLAVTKQLWNSYPIDSKIIDNLMISASPITEAYRVKMEFVISDGRLGMRSSENYFDVIDLQTCPLVSDELLSKVRRIYDFAHSIGIADFHLKNKTGQLRYLVTKTDRMLQIITTPDIELGLIKQLSDFALEQNFASVYHLTVPAQDDKTFGDYKLVAGTAHINLRCGNLDLLVGPNTFTQNNLPAFNDLLDFVRSHTPKGDLLDLYCGIGTIGLNLISNEDELLGVDEIVDSIELAKINATNNKIENTNFITAPVAEFLPLADRAPYQFYKQSAIESRYRTDKKYWPTVIADPARPGLAGKVARRIWKYYGPETLIYISCNPITQWDDYRWLQEHYELIDWKLFDLFPHTHHCESVQVFKLKD